MSNIKIHVFHTGEVCVAPDLPFGGDNSNAIKASGVFGKKEDRLWLPVSAYLIEHPKGKFLVDTGWAREMSPNGEFDKQAQIKSLGSVMEHVLSCVTEDSTVLIAVVQEDIEGAFDVNFSKFSAEITRFDAAEVAAEIAEAERVQEEMARQDKRERREAKKQDRKQAIEEHRERIKGRFSDIKAKFSKK